MGLEKADVVDAIGVDKDSGTVILTVVDSWDWADERGHLLALQEKLNAYFEFIERGQIWDSYPQAQGRAVVIDVVARYPMPPPTTDFWLKASEAASQLDVRLSKRVVAGLKPA